MAAVVSDSSPLIYLAWLGQFDLLRLLYGRLLVPATVGEEVAGRGGKLPGAAELRAAMQAGWIASEMPEHPLEVAELAGAEIDPGEAQAIALARERRAILIIDDLDGRKLARRLGVEVTGTLGVLVRAKRQNLVPALRPLVSRLFHETNFHLAKPLIDATLAAVGEEPLDPKSE
jgi:uncharacterized protein